MSGQTRYFLSPAYFALNSGRTDTDIVIVALDEQTLNSPNFKRYQEIDRCDYASLLRNILEGEPKAIGVDVFFAQHGSDISCDKELLDIAESNANVVYGTEMITKIENDTMVPVVSPLFGDQAIDNIALVDTFSRDKFDFTPFSTRQIINTIQFYPSITDKLPLSVEIYKRTIWAKSVTVKNDTVYFDSRPVIPLHEDTANINFFTGAYQTVSFVDVIERRTNPEVFRGKTVFIGATAHDIHDEFLTPFDTSNFMPGVVIHANMYNTLSSGSFLNYEGLVPFIIINFLLIVLFVGILLLSTNIVFGIGGSFAVLLTFFGISLLAFGTTGYYIDIFPAVIAYILTSLAVYLQKYLSEKKSKDEVRSIFSRYISEDVANEILKVGIGNLGLWGKEREISVFFSDIAGFTELSEKLHPSDLGKILNVYFEEMSSIILASRGTIDKFIGDAIMAFWNAPLDLADHATSACTAALLQRKALEKVKSELVALGSDVVIDMRIGINTGKAIIGNFGCSRRYDYTALGDTVNLSSRLESINKQYGTNIIISEYTFDKINPSAFLTRELDLITVKGKSEPIRIYELLDFSDGREVERLLRYREALKLYRNREFFSAHTLFCHIDDAPSRSFVKRCEQFMQEPPDPDWDGVYRFRVK